MKITCKGVRMNDLEKIEFYKERNTAKSIALDKILVACLEAKNQENIFDIADDALKYIVVLEKKLEEYHPNGKGYKDDADVRDLSSKYWGHVK